MQQGLGSVRTLRYLEDLWDESAVRGMDEADVLRYRSNLLGHDLRITNYGGGNTSSKIRMKDPLGGTEPEVLWVKGSGGDLGSIRREGFAALYLDKLLALEHGYRGVAYEDEMVDLYPLCAFGTSKAAPSIDTPLHAFLPYPHVDHLHPDWGIAIAASANGKEKMEEFNGKFGHKMIWIPWQRPGFELAMMLRRAVQASPSADGIILGGHGLITWGNTQRECYLNTLRVIDHMGQFVVERIERLGDGIFGGQAHEPRKDRRELAVDLFPFLRGRVSGKRRMIGHFTDLPEVLRFIDSKEAASFAHQGTSCPDHFLRTKIRPLFVAWDPRTGAMDDLRSSIEQALVHYRKDYEAYYREQTKPDSPAMRDPNPTVVLVPGVGLFSFGKNKTEARIAGEFYVNAIHVMEGATAMDDGHVPDPLPQSGAAAPSTAFHVYRNYVALPPSEAFGIEYWALEEAKLRRQPPEKEFSRKILTIIGAGSGIGREVALMAAERGAHVAVCDRDSETSAEANSAVTKAAGSERSVSVTADISNRESVRAALRQTVAAYGGVDIVVVTAAVFPSSPDGRISDAQWRQALDVNVTGNYFVADEVHKIFADQALPAVIVLTSSANAVVPKMGSEAYDVSKAALSHLTRELAVSLAPNVRVNAIAPATVVGGSSMFPRDRVLASLAKYGIAHSTEESTEELRSKLADFYARRTLTRKPIETTACAEAILFLAGDRSPSTTGHVIPVDGGLVEAFLR
jgi:rhamnose utilization protein RhaD (predicted bifunctional aldolase and dehydrogenase)/NAD(P)-dependent dehydrogenase (short-subunit alcohol dehydrogenase family)